MTIQVSFDNSADNVPDLNQLFLKFIEIPKRRPVDSLLRDFPNLDIV